MQNLLPYDGEVYYYSKVLPEEEADRFFTALKEQIAWEQDEGMMFGKRYVTDRKVAWYGDQPYDYNYAQKSRKALPWTNALLDIKNRIEARTGDRFNSCLLNYYHHGGEGMGWHADNEKVMQQGAAIASISLGAERKFSFKHRETKEALSYLLENGSLLMMKGATQDHWLHSLPKTKKVSSPRINLTFRNFKVHS